MLSVTFTITSDVNKARTKDLTFKAGTKDLTLKAKDLTFKAGTKDLTLKAKDLTFKARSKHLTHKARTKDLTPRPRTCPYSSSLDQGHKPQGQVQKCGYMKWTYTSGKGVGRCEHGTGVKKYRNFVHVFYGLPLMMQMSVTAAADIVRMCFAAG